MPNGADWMGRKCHKCGTSANLVVDNRHPSGLGTQCKVCKRLAHKAAMEDPRRRAKYEQTQRNNRLRLKYGISSDQYDALREFQEGCCYICGHTGGGVALAVDHDHVTLRVRGLLCINCNHRLLGAANDDYTVLLRAADYLLDPPANYVIYSEEVQ